jgi:hypothetical protein
VAGVGDDAGVPIKRVAACMLAVLVVLFAAPPGGTAETVRVPACGPHAHVALGRPQAGSAYAGAFPSFSTASRNEDAVTVAKLSAFEAKAGKRLALATFSDHWDRGRIRFPAASVKRIWSQGVFPVVRMMPWSRQVEGVADPLFTMADVASGRWDRQLAGWADAARRSGVPMMVDFAPEMNGSWFPWSGALSGSASGARAYRNAYRHVVALFRARHAANVSFAFHVDAEPTSKARWNAAASYYPGDRYVDWVGASVYGSDDVEQPWSTFAGQLEPALASLRAVTTRRPFAVWEWGVVESPTRGDKARWIDEAFAALGSRRYSGVRAVSWWDERWQREDGRWNDLRIDSSPASLVAYRRGIGASRYLARPRLVCRADR